MTQALIQIENVVMQRDLSGCSISVLQVELFPLQGFEVQRHVEALVPHVGKTM